MEENLVWSVQNGDVNEVKKVLELNKGIVNSEIKGRKLLHFAADYGQSEMVEVLLLHGAEVNAIDVHGISPLLAAIYEGHIKCVHILLEKGADKNGKAPDGSSFMECAETDDIKNILK